MHESVVTCGAALVLLLCSPHARAGELSLGKLHEWPKEKRAPSMFGLALCEIGDVTGDKVTDLAISDPLADEVWVVSGRDWIPVARIQSVHAGLEFGGTLAGPGDLDGDGVPDLLVGACPEAGEGGDTAPTAYARVFAYSGADWKELYVLDLDTTAGGANCWYSSGSWPQICPMSDIDADGVVEIAIGAPFDDAAGVDAGKVLIYSGRTGTLVRTVAFGREGGSLGVALASLPDIDGDGFGELAVSASPSAHPSYSYARKLGGLVYILSGKSSSVIWTLSGPTERAGFGSSLALTSDQDGDEIPDLLVGQSFARGNELVALMSCKTGKDVRFWRPRGERDTNSDVPSFGVKTCQVGDIDGDGQGDVLITQPSSFGGRYSAAVYSGQQDKVLWSIPIIPDLSHFGVEILRVEQCAGLEPILVVSAASWRGSDAFPGVVQIYSEANREVLGLLTRSRLEAAFARKPGAATSFGKGRGKATQARRPVSPEAEDEG